MALILIDDEAFDSLQEEIDSRIKLRDDLKSEVQKQDHIDYLNKQINKLQVKQEELFIRTVINR